MKALICCLFGHKKKYAFAIEGRGIDSVLVTTITCHRCPFKEERRS